MKDYVLKEKPATVTNETVWPFDLGHPLRLERCPSHAGAGDVPRPSDVGGADGWFRRACAIGNLSAGIGCKWFDHLRGFAIRNTVFIGGFVIRKTILKIIFFADLIFCCYERRQFFSRCVWRWFVSIFSKLSARAIATSKRANGKFCWNGWHRLSKLYGQWAGWLPNSSAERVTRT